MTVRQIQSREFLENRRMILLLLEERAGGIVLICRRRGDESFGPALLTSCPTIKSGHSRAGERILPNGISRFEPLNLVGTARCAVRAAFSGAIVPPAASRAGTSQRDVPTNVRFMGRTDFKTNFFPVGILIGWLAAHLTPPPPGWFFLDKIFAGRKVKIVKRKNTRPSRAQNRRRLRRIRNSLQYFNRIIVLSLNP